MTEKQFYTAKEVAQILSISKDTVMEMAKNGRLRSIDIGAGSKAPKKRFPRSAIDELAKGNGTETEGSPRPAADDGE